MLPQTHDELARLLALSPAQLHANRRRAAAAYRIRLNQKGSKQRELRVPDFWLRRLQRTLLARLRPRVPVSVAAMAHPGRGVLDHARAHLGLRWCHTTDVQDCFPSITRRHVFRALKSAGFGTDAIGAVLDLTVLDNQLPQGAPCSSWLVDVVFRETDDLMLRRARRSRFRYSRYLDDIAVSGRDAKPLSMTVLYRCLERLELRVNRAKTETVRSPTPALITGVEVSVRTMRPTAQFMRELEADIRTLNAGFGSITIEDLRSRLSWVRQVNKKLAEKCRARIRPAVSKNDG